MAKTKQRPVKVKKQDNGFYFEDFDVHVVANTEEEAIANIKKYHGIDVQKTDAIVKPDLDPEAGIVDKKLDHGDM